ncbi:MAG: DinB family protein [Ferruginibacter sp.]|nr:DinB family protein [Cytophagales bacterium]
MNSESQRIIHLLKNTYDGTPWYGPSVKALLSGVTAAQAKVRPLANGHTIGEIVGHVTAWREFTWHKLQGRHGGPEANFDIHTPQQDWPTAERTSPADWQARLSQLETSQQQLIRSLEALSDHELAITVPGRKYALYVLLHGIIQHDAYHAGQIALLKKALGDQDEA